VKNRALYEEPKGTTPPPFWIRALLILTCTGVSFAHGSNDGQKGMGLIMLILIGTVPMAYALNRAMPVEQMTQFVAVAEAAQRSLAGSVTVPAPAHPNQRLSDYVPTKTFEPDVVAALAAVTGRIAGQVRESGTLSRVPVEAVSNVRHDMYLASETIRFLDKNSTVHFDADTKANLAAFKREIDGATKFIPLWVKVAVAVALGLGTMVGWKRIVVTVGEKIGKTHLTYGQGASAELVAMLTIGAADMFGLPVSTTHASLIGRRRNHGGQRLRPAVVDRAQSLAGMGADAARRDAAVSDTLLRLYQGVLMLGRSLHDGCKRFSERLPGV